MNGYNEDGEVTDRTRVAEMACEEIEVTPEYSRSAGFDVVSINLQWRTRTDCGPPEHAVAEKLDSILGQLRKIKKLTLKSFPPTLVPSRGICKLKTLSSLILTDLTEIPIQIGLFTQIKELTIHRSFAIESLPVEIGGLAQNLESLKISMCLNLKSLPPEIGKLEHLKELRISECHPRLSFPAEIVHLLNLQDLHLGVVAADKFARVPRVCRMRNLKTLSIHGVLNGRSPEMVPVSVSNLENLSRLNIKCSSLMNGSRCIPIIPLASLQTMKYLKVVQIHSCSVIPFDLKHLEHLETLRITNVHPRDLSTFFMGPWNGRAAPKKIYIDGIIRHLSLTRLSQTLRGFPKSLDELHLNAIPINDWNQFLEKCQLPRGIKAFSSWTFTHPMAVLDDQGASCLEKLVNENHQLGRIPGFLVSLNDRKRVFTPNFFYRLLRNRCGIDNVTAGSAGHKRLVTTAVPLSLWPMIFERVTREFANGTIRGIPPCTGRYCPDAKSIEAYFLYDIMRTNPATWMKPC